MQTRISTITEVDDLGSSPARVNRLTGELFVNKRLWADMPKEHKLFVLLHEAAHATLNTTDEHKADAWAFEQYAKLGYPLSESVKALTRVLNFSRPDHYKRANDQLNRALLYDKLVNKYDFNNPKPLDMELFKTDTNTGDINDKQPGFSGFDDQEESFLGFGKAAKAKRKARAEVKIEKKKAKVALITKKGDAIMELAKQGIGSGIGKQIGDTIGNLGAKLLGGGGAASTATTDSVATDSADPSGSGSNNTMIIIGVVIFVVVIAGIFFFRSKNK